ncbi:MAG TPA: GspE/PulE family protein [Burkholderiales bacterium]|nr:GspE/PulE family protein [Burkholderiales bacterium]
MTEPDRTTKLLRKPRTAEAIARSLPPFVWPAPPYYEYVKDTPHEGEPCVLSFTDGRKAVGLLENFLPEHYILKFQAATEKASATVAFSDLLSLQLLNAAQLEVHTLPEGAGLEAPQQQQPFLLDLSDGNRFEGDTTGHVQALCGIFLFVPQGGRRVLRWFVPATAIRESRVGAQMGQILIDEHGTSKQTISEALEMQKRLRARKLGEYLTANQIVSQEQLAAALKQQVAQPAQKIGDTLIELGFLTRPELNEALAIEARDRSVPLGEILAGMGVVDMNLVHGVMAKKLGVPFVDLRRFQPSPEALKRLPPSIANRYQVLPLTDADNALVVAVDNPSNMERMEEVRFIAGTKLIPVMAPPADIKRALELAYGPDKEFDAAVKRAERDVGIDQLTQRLSFETGIDEAAEQQSAQIDSTLVKLVNKIITDAVDQQASDIHIESNLGVGNVRVRFRKDGALVTYLEIPTRFCSAVISRLKIMSQLDISERRKPQDGKIPFKRFGPRDVELRIATIPTANGLEDVVMRVLAATTPKPIDELGFNTDSLETIKRLISRPHGLFLVCGPTGSGKTTTLHSLLGFLNTPELKIWTAEDPIEITQAGLRQVQMQPKIGWTFAAAMRSFMRADPDVIMVGEMRDAETTRIGIEASLTGHLVLSTLHTNSAAESVVRLLDLGMDPFNFADALLGVLSQRLVRKLCAACRVAHQPTVKEMEELAIEYCGESGSRAEKRLKKWRQTKITMFAPKGCSVCDRTGYKGRIPVYELMEADPAVKRLIQARAPVSDIAAAAVANDMRTLKQDGIQKVLKGYTDMHQVRAV